MEEGEGEMESEKKVRRVVRKEEKVKKWWTREQAGRGREGERIDSDRIAET